jgi:murein DD-endopeptidase MepM/ murein hydrolase activator NlpD
LSLSFVSALALASACAPPPDDRSSGPARAGDLLLVRDSEELLALVPQRTTLASLLQAHALIAHEATALIASIGQRFDLRRFRAGQRYRLERLLDGRVREFEYDIDRDRRVRARRRDLSLIPAFDTEVALVPKTLTRVTVDGAITHETPSLVQALGAAGEEVELSLAMAGIFSGELDFNADLQPGDTFRVLVDRATREGGEFAGYGPVMAAELVNDGRRLRAFRFTSPNGRPGYYDADGRSLTRLFLKSPLKFEPRVTSSFSRARRHPILDYTRAHNGVDYRAPAGAPVAAVASGVVMFAGWTNGGGRTVRVRHAGGYESEYLHLSSIASGIRSGARVTQAALLGRVGATGLATGPHLHYGLRRNGAYVNPAREHQNMPPGEPIAPEHLLLFATERDRVLGLLSR